MGICDSDDYQIRYSINEDQPILYEWLKEPDVRFWYPIASDLDTENMSKNWIGFSRYKAGLTATYQGQVVGMAVLFLMPYFKVSHHCLMYFLVNPAFNGKGIGTSIVKNITHLGKTYFHYEWINVEIWEGCPATSIFKKAGYQAVFDQKKYIRCKDGTFLSRSILEYSC